MAQNPPTTTSALKGYGEHNSRYLISTSNIHGRGMIKHNMHMWQGPVFFNLAHANHIYLKSHVSTIVINIHPSDCQWAMILTTRVVRDHAQVMALE